MSRGQTGHTLRRTIIFVENYLTPSTEQTVRLAFLACQEVLDEVLVGWDALGILEDFKIRQVNVLRAVNISWILKLVTHRKPGKSCQRLVNPEFHRQ